MTDAEIEKAVAIDPVEEEISLPRPGQQLKALREAAGLSIESAAESLHLTRGSVRALEEDEYEKLPGSTFIKGYFKNYAELVDADIEVVLQSYAQHSEALEETVKKQAKVIRSRKNYDLNIRWLIWMTPVILIILLLSWWFNSG